MKKNTYLGIDVGSISTNLVLLDEQKQVVAKRYLPTAGRPIEAVQQGLKELQAELGNDINILGAGTTGSGRYLIADMIGADLVKNEITAQATAAAAIDPLVDTVFEIGGQDSKYIYIKNGAVTDFTMNKVCAAGTGSFLEEQADKLGINIKDEFSHLAAAASHPASLGDRCTVFIESELNNQLQKGADKPALAAGLALAIVKNYLNKVVAGRKIGQNVFFQGGVAFNRAVVKAFEQVLNKKITVPPHHEVTGAIGIALAVIENKSWSVSRFKGFQVSRSTYQTKSFECQSCENLCEINMVSLDNEAPAYYGGRCEKWENRRETRDDGRRTKKPLPDLFKERDAIIFSQEVKEPKIHSQVPSKKTIGIPRALFFFERFPFWNTFFSQLGFEVVLSSPSNQKMVQASLENIATEACFPVTLTHGHILDLLDKQVDFLFLPSLINTEKSSDKFVECFNCPFIQALPYFAKAGIKFKPGTKVLSPSLQPQRGKKFLKKQLARLGRQLGKDKKEVQAAFRRAEAEYARIRDHFKARGREILKQIEQKNLPALVIISRPYNGSDPALNLSLPKKLGRLGVLALPMDYLPVSRAHIADEHADMYWNYGQQSLAAARFVEQHPGLSAVHITNFRCGPDSFISHLIKETISSKPYLEIEVDEHASDTGVITRLEAFLDSLGNSRQKAVGSKQGKVEHGTQSTEHRVKSRTLFIPHMCDHAFGLAAAIRAAKMEARVLPPSDEKTLELGKEYTSGKECHPFIITTGDFLKKVREPGLAPSRTAFLMPSASGPCRFGHYHKVQRLLLKKLGYGDIPILSPDVKNAYSDSLGLSPAFRFLIWNAVVAVDYLQKTVREVRPREKTPGESDRLYQLFLERICRAAEAGGRQLKQVMRDVRDAFQAVPISSKNHKPVIGIVGELFLRGNPHCNADIVHRIEKLGGQAWVAPHSEWIYYTNLGHAYESFMRGNLPLAALILGQDLFLRWQEHRLTRPLKDLVTNYHEPSTFKVIDLAAPYLHYTFKGEAVLSVGKAVDFINKGAAGIINIMPFTCMPGTVVAALAKKIREKHRDIPWLDLAIDGSAGVNLETRLEAFMHQAQNFAFAREAELRPAS